MLKWMKLKNLALVEEAEVVFGKNFNVISGETGAGKSVIMGGIGLLLGTRADKSYIRTGCDKCEISAEFDISAISEKSPLKNILKEYDLCSEDSGDALFIRRVITAASTRNYVNGVPASLQVLREIGRVLVDIHAANENQSLLDDREQLAALDRYSGVQDKLKDCQQEWNNLKKLQEDKASFLASIPSEREISILKQELEEIESVDPKVGEDEELEKKHEVAGHAKTILEIASGVSSALTEEDESLVNQIASVRRVLVGLEHVDKEQGAHFVAELDGISESVSDLSMRLHDYASSVELNEMEFQAMEERMHVIRSLKRRYGPSLEEVLIYEDELKKKIVSFEDQAEIIRQYSEWEKQIESSLKQIAAAVSAQRKEAAKTLCGLLSAETVKLGFKQANFIFDFSLTEIGPNGFDVLQIKFSANPGIPPKPLKDVASSGEISRVMLAMKTILAEADSIPVLIFDELDANIGGETAGKVGHELKKLAEKKQVICISHSPQVASCGDKHFLVYKKTNNNMTQSTIHELNHEERIVELSRMLGGGEAAKQYALTMLT